jgi:glycerophosphoryl diester phosphodiesterase
MTFTHIPTLVAHRGYAARYPENTLLALREAVRAGACYVEFDVQMTADGVPVLLHDDDLQRMAGANQCIHDLTLDQARRLSFGEAARFGDAFAATRIATLAEAVQLLQAAPTVTAFVEIKRASLRRFGVDTVLHAVLAQVDALRGRCVLISFDEEVLRRARLQARTPIGWVFEPWSDEALATARALQPEYVFTDHEQIPAAVTRLPAGAWSWALYEIADAHTALQWAARGADLIETHAVGELLQHAQLRERSCRRGGTV